MNPEILVQETLPAPLVNLSPRTIMPTKWWDVSRKEAYAKYDDCCHACGTHKTKAWYRKNLEGHEIYSIDYDKKRVRLVEVVALCHSCHNFIHVGRLIKNYNQDVISESYLRNVLSWGVGLLSRYDLSPGVTQAIHYLIHVKGLSEQEARDYVSKIDSPYKIVYPGEWSIEIDGNIYKDKTLKEWNYA